MSALIDAAIKAGLSGLGTGAIIGGGARFMAGGTKDKILKSALTSAGLGAGIAGGTQLLGSSVMGDPEEEEGGSPYAMRGALGGALGGGGLGALLGLLAVTGKIPKMPVSAPAKLRDIVGKIKGELPMNNFIVKEIQRMAANPTGKNLRKATAYGAGLGGIPGALIGADEGQAVDTVLNEYQMQKLRDSYNGY